MSDETDEIVSKRLTDVLQSSLGEAPAGFAFRVMQRILQERIHRAEAAAHRQALLVAMGFTLLALVGLYGLSLFGFGSVEWLDTLPLAEASWLGCGLFVLFQLDRLCSERPL